MAGSSDWSTSLFDLCGGPDVGGNCCLQNCCCQPCTWGDALRRAGVREGSTFTIFVLIGGNSLLDEAAGYLARRRLVEKYDIREDPVQSCVFSCCCAPCARLQEINTVMTRERLVYDCASLKEAAPPQLSSSSKPSSSKVAQRTSSKLAPPKPSTMTRTIDSRRRVR